MRQRRVVSFDIWNDDRHSWLEPLHVHARIQVGKKLGNQPLDDAIMGHLRMKRISPEEAYDKALDKKKFRSFLTHPPDDEE